MCKNRKTPENTKERKIACYKFGRWLVTGAMAVFIVVILGTMANVIELAMRPSSEVILNSTGTSYEFRGMIGYASLEFRQIPVWKEMVSEKTFCVTYLVISTLVQNVPMLLLLFYTRKIFFILKDSYSPFVEKVFVYTRIIGILMVAMGVLGKLLFQIGMAAIVYRTFYVHNPWEFQWIIAGILVLVISDIFRKGCELQQFSDETL